MNRDTDEEISEIKREMTESRNLVIKTNNLVTGLGADMKAIAKRQAKQEQAARWNNGAVYLIIAALSFAGLKLASDARIREVRSEMQDTQRRVEELETDLGEEVRKSSERASADAKAKQFYELIRERKRTEALAGYESVSKEPLSSAEQAFFRDAIRQFGSDLSVAAYREGLAAAREGRHKQALARFQSALERGPDASFAPAIEHQLALALHKLGRSGEALVHARKVGEQTLDKSLQPAGWWLVAECARDLRDLDTARQALKTLIRGWPKSARSRGAPPLLRELTRQSIRGRQSE